MELRRTDTPTATARPRDTSGSVPRGQMDEINDEERNEGAGADACEPGAREDRFENSSECWFGHDSDRNTSGSDANLACGQVDLEILGHLPGAVQRFIAISDELVLAILTRPGEGEFDGDEEPVGQYQEQTPG